MSEQETARGDDHRVCLEGRHGLLEETCTRYRTLLRALRSARWEERLRRSPAVLREAARHQAEVDAVLVRVERRAAAEGWRPEDEVLRCAHTVQRLRAALDSLLSWRDVGTSEQ